MPSTMSSQFTRFRIIHGRYREDRPEGIRKKEVVVTRGGMLSRENAHLR